MVSGESVLWVGRPGSLLAREALDYYWASMGVFWAVFVPQLLATGTAVSGPVQLGLVGAVGPVMAVSEMVWRRRKWKTAVYVLTNKRAAIVNPSWRVPFRVVLIESVTCTVSSLRGDGSGTLTFWPAQPPPDLFRKLQMIMRYEVFSFVGVAHATSVRGMLG